MLNDFSHHKIILQTLFYRHSQKNKCKSDILCIFVLQEHHLLYWVHFKEFNNEKSKPAFVFNA